MDVVTLQCYAHQADVHFRQVIVSEDDSYYSDDDFFECFVLFVVHNSVSVSAAGQFTNIQRASFAEVRGCAKRRQGLWDAGGT